MTWDGVYDRAVTVSSDQRSAAEAVMPDVVAVSAEPLAGGSSASVVALSLRSPDGDERTVVFRQHTNRAAKDQARIVAAKEFHLTDALVHEGLEVARPLALHGDATTDGPWLVSECVEGTTDVAEHQVDSVLTQMADYLARLHRVDPGRLSVPGIVEIENPVEALPRYLLDDDTGRSIGRMLETGIERRPNPSVLLHGDYWPGNVMFDDGRLVAVLDWEDATWGDPLVDLACARVELTCAYGPGASERFTASYFDAHPQLGRHDLALWEVYVAATALSAMHRWGLAPSDEAARRHTTTHFLDVALERLGAT